MSVLHSVTAARPLPKSAHAETPAQGPCVTLEPPKTSSATGVGAKPPFSMTEPLVRGLQNRVPDPVLRVCSSCGQQPVTGPKQSRCNDCRARSERKRRASVTHPTKHAHKVIPKRTCVRCKELFQPEGRARRCDSCRLAVDPKTSQCAFCLAIYTSHDDSRAGTAERWHHARKACLA